MNDKRQAMDDLRAEGEILAREVCESGVRLVWGEGDLHSPLVLVGEAPGGTEDRLGRPFVGEAGKLLESELLAAGANRADVYITNVVKCRPVKSDRGVTSNRTPTSVETSAWSDLLTRELGVIQPKVILCLGAIAASALIHRAFRMTAERGAWSAGPLGARIMATYHPSYLLRSISYGDRQALEDFRADLRAALEAAK